MHHQLIGKSRLGIHLLLATVLIACAAVLAHSPSLWRAVLGVAATAFAAHAGLAIVIHFSVALAGTGVLFAAVRAHGREHRGDGDQPGSTLHSPRFYDWLAAAYCLGREGKMREIKFSQGIVKQDMKTPKDSKEPSGTRVRQSAYSSKLFTTQKVTQLASPRLPRC